VVHDLATQLARDGDAVTVLSGSPEPRPAKRSLDGFNVVQRPGPRRLGRLLGWSDTDRFAVTAAVAGVMAPADIHHAFFYTDAFGLAVARHARRRPLVISLHGIPGRAWWEEHHPRAHRWFEYALARADAVTVMNDISAAAMRRDYDHDPVVLEPGIFVADYGLPRRPPPRRRLVCSAAIDDPRKRMDVLIQAFALVAAEAGDVDLLLVGRGDASALRGHLDAVPPAVRERIIVRAVDDLPSLFAECTAGVLTSTAEAFGLAAVEYLAAGMPAVVSDDAGSTAIVTDGTGVAFTAGNVEACASAIVAALRLAEDPGTADCCRARGRQYDWSLRLPAYRALYQEVLENHRHG
jgi:glycosyltransferase involved in cell wall biosynthesis